MKKIFNKIDDWLTDFESMFWLKALIYFFVFCLFLYFLSEILSILGVLDTGGETPNYGCAYGSKYCD